MDNTYSHISPTFTKTDKKYICWCGAVVLHEKSKSKHVKTKKHKKFVYDLIPLPKDINTIIIQYING